MECEYNQEGFCIVADVLGRDEIKDWKCPFNQDNHCTVKSEDLAYCCPDCDSEDCDGNCTTEESVVVPKNSSTVNLKGAK